ncbi:MAG: ribosome biogenesis GTPase YlqF [Oscillospiraceae bacterium]|nr:ribosome biogenesis GTPase YlqF [Oscillospiraceae bacterium]
MNIQWYPGHMTKARRMISENIKLIDAVCEVIDARIPISSRNPELLDMTKGKPIIIIFNRIDQADAKINKKWAAQLSQDGAAIIETDSKTGKGVDSLETVTRKLLAEKISLYKAKGQAGRQIRLMVVGIPNVGKSSFINRLAKRKAAQTADKPGVTRGKQWINLGNGIELLDTPGVLWPKFEDQTIAENLAFTGAIRDQVIDVETLAANLMFRLSEFYPDRIKERYKIEETIGLTGFELLERAAKKRGFLISGGEYDLERMAIVLLDEFRGGKLGRISLEWTF